MKEISYNDAIELMAFSGRNDIRMAIFQDMKSYTIPELYQIAQVKGGVKFFVPDDELEEVETPEEKPKRTPLDKNKVLALHYAGWSAAKIADEMRCSAKTIYGIISKSRKEEKEVEVTA